MDINSLEFRSKYFIENGTHASYFKWLRSKGTNYDCYLEYTNSLSDEQKLDNKIDIIRTIIYTFDRPIQFIFFYWTILIFILHRFKLQKPVMKIILYHYIIRTSGNIFDKIGELFSYYHSSFPIKNANGEITGYKCISKTFGAEGNPLRWLISRQIASIFWYFGEIIADWYPLLRTRAVAKDSKSIWFVYITCGLFNLSKIALIVLHWTLSPTELYNQEGIYDLDKVNMFYFKYWCIQLLIIYTSVIYEFSVYFVLKKALSKIPQSNSGFLKKFKTISEYRMLISAVVSIIFLPIVSLTIIMKYYYYFKYGYSNLNFSFDDIRKSIANVQYYMIFIDQIFLLNSKEEVSDPGNEKSMTTDDKLSKYIRDENNSKFSHYNKRSTRSLSSSKNFQYENITNNDNNDSNTFINNYYSENTENNYINYNYNYKTNNYLKNFS